MTDIKIHLLELIKELAETDDVDTSKALSNFGLDSLDVIEIQLSTKRNYGVALTIEDLERFEHEPIDALCAHIASRIDPQTARAVAS